MKTGAMMKTKLLISCVASFALLATPRVSNSAEAAKEHVFEAKPLGVQLSIKMVGPYMEAADLANDLPLRLGPNFSVKEGQEARTNYNYGGLNECD